MLKRLWINSWYIHIEISTTYTLNSSYETPPPPALGRARAEPARALSPPVDSRSSSLSSLPAKLAALLGRALLVSFARSISSISSFNSAYMKGKHVGSTATYKVT